MDFSRKSESSSQLRCLETSSQCIRCRHAAAVDLIKTIGCLNHRLQLKSPLLGVKLDNSANFAGNTSHQSGSHNTSVLPPVSD